MAKVFAAYEERVSMADKVTLELENRTVLGKKVNRLRREGLIPATVYGKGVGPFAVQMDALTFTKTYRRAGRTTLIELQIPGQAVQSAFVHALQRHPVSRAITHVDFHVVDLLIEITVEVPIHVVGESELVERGDAVLNQVLTALDVRALPAELPPYVEVDISELDSFDKSIHVRDITFTGKGTIVTSEDELVVSLTPARVEEEEEAPVEEEEAAVEPELVREKHEEEEE
jgi:large subunit ribosomal protein L25